MVAHAGAVGSHCERQRRNSALAVVLVPYDPVAVLKFPGHGAIEVVILLLRFPGHGVIEHLRPTQRTLATPRPLAHIAPRPRAA